MTTILAATCQDQPQIQAHDQPLAHAFAKRGMTLTAAPWNGPQTPFHAGDPILVRSTWDYHAAPDAFASWLEQLSQAPHVFNPGALMHWNLSKRYLASLEKSGLPDGMVLPPMVFAPPTTVGIQAALARLNCDDVIVKPAVGCSAIGLTRVSGGVSDTAAITTAARVLDRALGLALNGAFEAEGLVQAFVPDIQNAGETSFIFIDGVFTHAVRKTPKAGDIRCQEEYGGAFSRVDPPDWAIETVGQVLSLLPAAPTYARIDVILLSPESAERLDGRMALMEVELIEPELCFHLAPEAAEMLAAAVIRKLT